MASKAPPKKRAIVKKPKPVATGKHAIDFLLRTQSSGDVTKKAEPERGAGGPDATLDDKALNALARTLLGDLYHPGYFVDRLLSPRIDHVAGADCNGGLTNYRVYMVGQPGIFHAWKTFNPVAHEYHTKRSKETEKARLESATLTPGMVHLMVPKDVDPITTPFFDDYRYALYLERPSTYVELERRIVELLVDAPVKSRMRSAVRDTIECNRLLIDVEVCDAAGNRSTQQRLVPILSNYTLSRCGMEKAGVSAEPQKQREALRTQLELLFVKPNTKRPLPLGLAPLPSDETFTCSPAASTIASSETQQPDSVPVLPPEVQQPAAMSNRANPAANKRVQYVEEVEDIEDDENDEDFDPDADDEEQDDEADENIVADEDSNSEDDQLDDEEDEYEDDEEDTNDGEFDEPEVAQPRAAAPKPAAQPRAPAAAAATKATAAAPKPTKQATSVAAELSDFMPSGMFDAKPVHVGNVPVAAFGKSTQSTAAAAAPRAAPAQAPRKTVPILDALDDAPDTSVTFAGNYTSRTPVPPRKLTGHTDLEEESVALAGATAAAAAQLAAPSTKPQKPAASRKRKADTDADDKAPAPKRQRKPKAQEKPAQPDDAESVAEEPEPDAAEKPAAKPKKPRARKTAAKDAPEEPAATEEPAAPKPKPAAKKPAAKPAPKEPNGTSAEHPTTDDAAADAKPTAPKQSKQRRKKAQKREEFLQALALTLCPDEPERFITVAKDYVARLKNMTAARAAEKRPVPPFAFSNNPASDVLHLSKLSYLLIAADASDKPIFTKEDLDVFSVQDKIPDQLLYPHRLLLSSNLVSTLTDGTDCGNIVVAPSNQW